MSRPARPREAELVLDPHWFAVAQATRLRVKLSTSRPPRWLLVREQGTASWAVFRVKRRHHADTPIAPRADPIDRVRCFAVLEIPPLAWHVPALESAKQEAAS